MTETFYSGEIQFTGFGESSGMGPWVRLRLQSPDDLSPFRGLSMPGGGMRGDRFAVVFVRLTDQEELEQKRGFPLGLAGLAVKWCADPDFQKWMTTEGYTSKVLEDDARDAILAICSIKSRNDLNADPIAAATFEECIRKPYAESRKARGLDG